MPARRKLSEHGIRNSDFIVTTENYSETRLEINNMAIYRTLQLRLGFAWRGAGWCTSCVAWPVGLLPCFARRSTLEDAPEALSPETAFVFFLKHAFRVFEN